MASVEVKVILPKTRRIYLILKGTMVLVKKFSLKIGDVVDKVELVE
jgi:hypothetical protein